jgi:hypothetical protein
MRARDILLLVGSGVLGYLVLLLVELVLPPPPGANSYVVALGGAFAGAFGYWYPTHRRRQSSSTG